MPIKCKCNSELFRVLLGATCQYVICAKCGQELGTIAEDVS